MRKTSPLTIAEWEHVASLARDIDTKMSSLMDITKGAMPLGDVRLIAALRDKHMLKVRSMLEDRMIGQVDPQHQDKDGRLLRLFFGQEHAGKVAESSQ